MTGSPVIDVIAHARVRAGYVHNVQARHDPSSVGAGWPAELSLTAARVTKGQTTMPTDVSLLPLMPVLPWQRPPPTRNRKGQWLLGELAMAMGDKARGQ